MYQPYAILIFPLLNFHNIELHKMFQDETKLLIETTYKIYHQAIYNRNLAS